MRPILVTTILLFGLILTSCNKNQTQNTDPGIKITFQNNTYNPNLLSIKNGQTVTFINQSDTDIWPASNIHPTHGIYPEFDPKKPVKPGESWSFIFTKIGTWRFHDHLQPQITGVITVE